MGLISYVRKLTEDVKRSYEKDFISPFLYVAGAFLMSIFVGLLINRLSGSNVDLALLFSIPITGACLITLALFRRLWISREERIRHLEARADELGLNLTKHDELFERFEEIIDNANKIRFGFIEFFPTSLIDAGAETPKGFGPSLMYKIFGAKGIRPSDSRTNWREFSTEMSGPDPEFLVLATPLYDTPNRREEVEFSSPLFYADIGIYVCDREKIESDESRGPEMCLDSLLLALERDKKIKQRDGDGRFGFADLKAALDILDDQIRATGYEGELQERMVKKYCPQAQFTAQDPSGNFSVASSIKGLLKPPEHPLATDIYFCERLQANGVEEVKNGKIKNILKNGELAFPVAIAIRKGEETLRKYINWRLMEIEHSHPKGMGSLLTEALERFGFQEDEIERYYVRQGPPFPSPDESPPDDAKITRLSDHR